MYSRIGSAIRYTRYYLTASNGKGHGVHSPFVFDFIVKVLNDDRYFYAYSLIEELQAHTGLDFKARKFNQLLFRIANYYSFDKILELGVSNGLGTAYMAYAKENNQVITWESNPEKSSAAAEIFKKLGLANIESVTGSFEGIYGSAIQPAGAIDLVVINENLAHDPVAVYKKVLSSLHNHSMLILNGVHASADMERAWRKIKDDEAVTLSIDLFDLGILLFRKENRVKQHFTIRF